MNATRVQTGIQLKHEEIVLKTKHPFGISYGSSSDSVNILVRLRWQDHEGLGEASPTEYHSETMGTATALLDQWAEEGILGDNPFAIEEIIRKLDKSVAGNGAAKAAIETALHDLVGKIVGQPTYRLLGLEGLPAPVTSFTIGLDTIEVIEKKTAEALADGHKVLKVKQGTTFDRDIIKAVRKVAPNVPIRVDANGAWTTKQAISMANWLAEQNVQFIEQPLPKQALPADFRFVREHSPLPIFADESCLRSSDVAKLAGCVDGVVVKLTKTGGITEAMKVIQTAKAHGMQIMFGCMVESSLGISAAAQLQGLCDYVDLDGAMLLANDPYIGLDYKDGRLVLSELPGLGVTARK